MQTYATKGCRKMKNILDDFVDAEIERRSQRGKKLAKRFSDFPAGLEYKDFVRKCFDEGLELDFITSCEMYDAYNGMPTPKPKVKGK